MAFYTETDIQAEEEFAGPKTLLNFKGVPEVLPIIPKQGFENLDYTKLVKKQPASDE